MPVVCFRVFFVVNEHRTRKTNMKKSVLRRIWAFYGLCGEWGEGVYFRATYMVQTPLFEKKKKKEKKSFGCFRYSCYCLLLQNI